MLRLGDAATSSFGCFGMLRYVLARLSTHHRKFESRHLPGKLLRAASTGGVPHSCSHPGGAASFGRGRSSRTSLKSICRLSRTVTAEPEYAFARDVPVVTPCVPGPAPPCPAAAAPPEIIWALPVRVKGCGVWLLHNAPDTEQRCRLERTKQQDEPRFGFARRVASGQCVTPTWHSPFVGGLAVLSMERCVSAAHEGEVRGDSDDLALRCDVVEL